MKALFEQVNEIDESDEYWFVRTDSGQFFETYLANDFIAIGWNYITIEDLRGSDEVVKAKIAKNAKLSLDDSNERGKVTAIYTKLLRFINLKKGDRIIIPSSNSDNYAFGIVASQRTTSDAEQSFDCEYYKRRKIKWLNSSPMSKLDPIFYKIRMSRHAISSVKMYASYIDKQMDALFFKKGNGHFVIDVLTTSDINLKLITQLINLIEEISVQINKKFELDEDISESLIKLNLQSPGKIELILPKGKTLVVFAARLMFSSTPTSFEGLPIPKSEKTEIKDFAEEHKKKLETLDSIMNKLSVDRAKINSGVVSNGVQ